VAWLPAHPDFLSFDMWICPALFHSNIHFFFPTFFVFLGFSFVSRARLKIYAKEKLSGNFGKCRFPSWFITRT
jgi:hypothetical protein